MAAYVKAAPDLHHNSRHNSEPHGGEGVRKPVVVRLDRAKLDRALVDRGWNLADLGRATGLSGPTLSNARQGRGVSPATGQKIAKALIEAEVTPLADLTA